MNKRDLDRLIRRSRDLLAQVSEQTVSPVGEVVAGVICNECGRAVLARAPSRKALEEALEPAFEGWTITSGAGDRDLCPQCTRRRAA